MQIKTFQFARHILINEINLPPEQVAHILDKEVHLNRPVTLSKLLFRLLYNTLLPLVQSRHQRDTFAIGLVHMIHGYLYCDHQDDNQMPAIIDFDKVLVPSLLIHDVVEPLVGRVHLPKLLYDRFVGIDACALITSQEELSEAYQHKTTQVSYHDYPVLAVNMKVHNDAARFADIMIKVLHLNFGADRSAKIIKNLLLNDETSVLGHIIQVLKIMQGDPQFVLSFLDYLNASVDLSVEEYDEAQDLQTKTVQADRYLAPLVKTATDNYTPAVQHQWSQWSMLMGLVEKQLGPMRGSMWPASENLSPFEGKLRKMILDRAKEKSKSQLNMEELLEVARDVYRHSAIEPGKLAEEMLKDNRVWKV